MTPGDATRAWNDALDDGIAAESAGWLTARQQERGLVFGDRPLCTVIRPRFLSPGSYRRLCAVSAALLEAFAVAGQRALDDAAFRAQFRLADWEVTLLERAPRLSSMAPLSRLDTFIDAAGTPWVTEYNAETPAGTAYTDVLAELFLALPAMREFTRRWRVETLPARHFLLGTLLDVWHRFRGTRTRPSIAIVDWDDVPTGAEFRLCRDYFAAMGYPCRITTPQALTYQQGVLRDADGTPVDLIYKRVLIHELVAEGGLDHPLVRAVLDGKACLVNPFSCKPLHKKASLAVLSDERNAALFPAVQREAIAQHVPWTRVVEHRNTMVDGTTVDLVPWIAANRSTLVLKPNDDYGGAGIVLGWEVEQAAWEAALRTALEAPYVVQRRIDLPYEVFPTVADGRLVLDQRIVDAAPFCWQGAYADGLLCRISTSTLVNVTAGGGSTVPTFVVAARE